MYTLIRKTPIFFKEIEETETQNPEEVHEVKLWSFLVKATFYTHTQTLYGPEMNEDDFPDLADNVFFCLEAVGGIGWPWRVTRFPWRHNQFKRNSGAVWDAMQGVTNRIISANGKKLDTPFLEM